MPPNSLLRPLPVDIILFAIPLLIGVGAFFLGRYFHRWSIAVRSGLIVLTVAAILLAWGILFHSIPRPIDLTFSYFGGVIVILCWIILGVIGISCATPDVGTDLVLRIIVSILPLGLIAVETGGSLWFRYKNTELWANRPRESGMMTQSTAKTCLPVAAAMLLHQYGVDDVSEGELAYLGNTSFFGTDNHVMARAITRKLGKRGVRAETIRTNYDDMVEREAPFIAQVQLEHIGNHAVLIRRITPHTLVWIDPLKGYEEHVEPHLFKLVWTGAAIVVDGMAPRPELAPAK
jgi:hypothetical protein